ncbi:STE3-domain-containing protein [Peniophora sp. CONT]|nr:STE3-domain-containing protein [Peniophora sp. CONT]
MAAIMLLLVLLTNFVRQSWNLGIAFLCFWLFLDTLIEGIDAVIWADNADIKLYVFCDIASHLQIIVTVVEPMATLIISRRLYLIANLESVEVVDQAAKRRDLTMEWILGLVIPVVVAGPLYYVVQAARFAVREGTGCGALADGSILSILLVSSWTVIAPLFSLIIYYPRVARMFYRHNRDINHFLGNNNSVPRTSYFRILALASIDVLLTLPIGITTIALFVTQKSSVGPPQFYSGWTRDHINWGPVSVSYADIQAGGASSVAVQYFAQWSSPVLAFVVFGLFGVTSEARASYRRIIYAIGGWLGWEPHSCRDSPLDDIEFGERSPQDMSLNLDSQLNYVNHNVRAQVSEQDAESGRRHGGTSEVESSLDNETVEEVRRASSDKVHAEPPPQHRDSYRVELVDASM